MELTNEFRVGTEVGKAWEVLTDVERIAPCLPGAELREIEGEEYRGVVKVKVGPITAEYKGAARFVELDAAGHKAVLRAEGRETRGQGNASATITAQLEPDGDGTKVSVLTDLSISGKVAQFGRGVLADVSGKLLGQFVENLEATVLKGGEPGGGSRGKGTTQATTEGRAADAGEPVSEKASKAAARTPAKSPASGPTADRPKAAARSGGTRTSTRPEKTEGESDNGSEPAGEPAASGEAGQPAGDVTEVAENAETESTETEGAGATVRRLEPRPAEPVDLVEVAGSSVARRFVPVILSLVVGGILFAIIRRLMRSDS